MYGDVIGFIYSAFITAMLLGVWVSGAQTICDWYESVALPRRWQSSRDDVVEDLNDLLGIFAHRAGLRVHLFEHVRDGWGVPLFHCACVRVSGWKE